MAEPTAVELEAKIAAIDTQISAIIASPTSIASYSIGQKSVSKKDVLAGLMEARKMYQELLNAIPSEGYNRWATEVDENGTDQTEYLGAA